MVTTGHQKIQSTQEFLYKISVSVKTMITNEDKLFSIFYVNETTILACHSYKHNQLQMYNL